MSRVAKTLERILRGTSDANIGFDDLRSLLRHLGFSERIRGGHHIFAREGVEEIVNLQPRGGKAKSYQVKQVRAVIVANSLAADQSNPQTTSSDDPDTATPEQENGNDDSV